MSINPFTRHAQRRVEAAGQKVMEEGGWGQHLTFETQRRDGQKLFFQMRLPDGMAMVDLRQVVQAAPGAPAFVGHALTAVAQAREKAGVIVVGGLCGANDPEQEVLATLTVALTELDGPFNVDDFMPEDSPATLHSKQDAAQVSEHMWRIHRISSESLGGDEKMPMLMIEYLFVTRYGVLAAAFAANRFDMMGDAVREIFDAISKTLFIGEKPAAV